MLARTVNPETDAVFYVPVDTAVMYNKRTGITYQFFNTCADTTQGCFESVRYDLTHSGGTRVATPSPTSMDPEGMPE